MNLLIQILTTLALVLGIICGEALSAKAFGTLKKTWLYLVEIAFFVTIIVMIFNTLALTEYSDVVTISIYFLSGFLTIVFVRGIITGLGVFSEHAKQVIVRQKDEKDYVVGLKKALERRNFDSAEIERIAKETGFSKKSIDNVFVYFGSTKNFKNKQKRSRKAY